MADLQRNSVDNTMWTGGTGIVITILRMYDLIIPYMEWLALLIPPVGGVNNE